MSSKQQAGAVTNTDRLPQVRLPDTRLTLKSPHQDPAISHICNDLRILYSMYFNKLHFYIA